jgi:thymidine kinase
LDFRGEPFGPMPYLMARADIVKKLKGVCEYTHGKIRCQNLSTRTQRLIDGKPANYDAPIILVEGSGKETYETRCLEHHFIPKDKLKQVSNEPTFLKLL